jgi:branched-chain amino acid transport system permease protein
MPESIVTILDVVIGGLLLGGIYALIAMGMSLQYGVARVLNFSHGEFIMLAAFGTFTLHTVVGINPLVCLVIVGPIIFIIGVLLHRTLFYQLSLRAPNPDAYAASSILASFGLLFILQNIALLGWGADYRAYTYLNFGVDIGGAIFSANKLVILGFAVGIGVAFYLFLALSRIGKAIRSAAQDPQTASLMGVNINQVLALCFGFGALMAGIAGVLLSMRVLHRHHRYRLGRAGQYPG